MANTDVFYRLYLREPIRKALGINLNRTNVYFFNFKNKAYLSTTAIPKHGKVKLLKAYIAIDCWCIDIPKRLLKYTPGTYRFLEHVDKILEILPE